MATHPTALSALHAGTDSQFPPRAPRGVSDPRSLTIIIPTYNRGVCLEALLNSLLVELEGLEGQVAVVIGDNASSDYTPTLIARFVSQWSDTLVLRHAANLGAEENFCRCVEQVQTSYFWIIGDDDLPRAGAVKALLPMLTQGHPDLVYLSSSWSLTLSGNEAENPLSTLDGDWLDQASFARRTHVWTTFISGFIVRRDFAPDTKLRRFTGSSLVQLGWVLEALKTGRRFLYIVTPCVLATSGNTGGYSVLVVFGQNFQRITRDMLHCSAALQQIASAMITRASIAFLPDLIWSYKQGRLGTFEAGESVAQALAPELDRTWVYHLLLLPLEHASPLMSKTLLKCAHGLSRLIRVYDRLTAKAVRC